MSKKSADKVEPKFKVGDKIQYLKGCGTIMTIEKIENGEYIFANNLGHTTIEDGNKWYLVERNPTWSEEDETTINNLVWAILNDCIRPQDREDYCDWLKSIRPQNHWKPTEERMRHLWLAAHGDTRANVNYLIDLYNDLKKLTE